MFKAFGTLRTFLVDAIISPWPAYLFSRGSWVAAVYAKPLFDPMITDVARQVTPIGRIISVVVIFAVMVTQTFEPVVARTTTLGHWEAIVTVWPFHRDAGDF